MTIDWRVTNSCFAILVSLHAATGCNSEAEPLPDLSVTVPDELRDGGTAWQRRTTLEPSDNQCLAKFFTMNQGLSGSPEFVGQPTVFTSGKNDRRFYWLSSTVDGVRWQCVEFRQRKFSVSDGTDNPFE